MESVMSEYIFKLKSLAEEETQLMQKLNKIV